LHWISLTSILILSSQYYKHNGRLYAKLTIATHTAKLRTADTEWKGAFQIRTQISDVFSVYSNFLSSLCRLIPCWITVGNKHYWMRNVEQHESVFNKGDQEWTNVLSFYFVTSTQYRKHFQMKVVDKNEIHIFYQAQILCTMLKK
jgi:hypothetical protein